jgi:hypothetical protein
MPSIELTRPNARTCGVLVLSLRARATQNLKPTPYSSPRATARAAEFKSSTVYASISGVIW